MKIIISPAKKMNMNTDFFPAETKPLFLEKTAALAKWMKKLSFAEAKDIWKCNEQIAELNYRRFQDMDFQNMDFQNMTPALFSYEGIQYQYISALTMTGTQLDYVRKHLVILSGFYGVLRPFDGVVPYRLEMQAKVSAGGGMNLYDFWKDMLYREVVKSGEWVVNLASKEYSVCIERYLNPGDHFLSCVFGEEKDGKVIQKGTMAKMARGEMVRFLAEEQIFDMEEIKKFHGLGYRFRPELSVEKTYVYTK